MQEGFARLKIETVVANEPSSGGFFILIRVVRDHGVSSQTNIMRTQLPFIARLQRSPIILASISIKDFLMSYSR